MDRLTRSRYSGAQNLSISEQQFVLRCGSVHLGPKETPRVASVERAIKFASRQAASYRADLMRGNSSLPASWQVVSTQEAR